MTINQSSSTWDYDHLRLAIDAAGVALWSWNVDNDRLIMDEKGCDLWGPSWADGSLV